jgi:hypothetical protein
MSYKRFASYEGTSTAADIKDTQWSTITDVEDFVCDKLTFIADAAVSVKVNGADNWSPLDQDENDMKYKLNFDKGDILVKTFEVNDAVDYWVGFLY